MTFLVGVFLVVYAAILLAELTLSLLKAFLRPLVKPPF